MKEKVQVSVEVLNKILNYMATKPYIEVVQLIKEIEQDLSENHKQEDKTE